MIKVGVTVKINTAAVEKAAKDASFRNLGHVGGVIRKTVVRSIRKRKDRGKHSAPGSPPFTHIGERGAKWLYRRSFFYALEGKTAVYIGSKKSVAGPLGRILEHGGSRGNIKIAPRPAIGPALEAHIPALSQFWRDSMRR